MAIPLTKAIASRSSYSRRQAEALIRAGAVMINGRRARLGEGVEEKDRLVVKGRELAAARGEIYIKVNKPKGYTCTNRSFPGEKNIFSLVKIPTRLFCVGRLDKDSQGLVLLTNDGDLSQKLAHPRYEHGKVYEVRVRGKVTDGRSIVKQLMKGVDLGEGDGLGRARAGEYLQNGFFIITLSEGKKRQIRRMFQTLNLEVIDLKRTALAGLELGDIKTGRWAYLDKGEINKLKDKV